MHTHLADLARGDSHELVLCVIVSYTLCAFLVSTLRVVILHKLLLVNSVLYS